MKKSIVFYTTFISLVFSTVGITIETFAQSTFQKTYGGNAADVAYAFQQLTDGGYIIAGYTESFGEGNRDVYLVRTDSEGTVLWTKTYGNTNTDYAWTIDQTTDGGFIIGAHTDSFGAGGHDIYLIKTDSEGTVLWTKVFGGTSADGAYSLQQTFDDGFIIAAHTSSFGEGQHEVYLLKTDPNGNILWTKSYGNTGGDFLRAIDQTPDQGYIMVAETYSFGAGGSDIYVIRTDAQGDTLWTKTFGGAGDDFGYSIRLTNDQAYIIAGHTRSFGQGQLDMLLMKIDDQGNLLWAKTYGGLDEEYGYSVEPTDDGGYIVSGSTKSFAKGGFCDILCDDVYLIKTDANGDTLWTKTYGSLAYEVGWSVRTTSDGGYAVVGISTGFGAGGEDFYLIKTDENGNLGCQENGTSTVVGSPNIIVNSTTTIVNSGVIENSSSTLTSNPATLENTVCFTTGFNKINNFQKFHVYPNPAKHEFYMEIDLKEPQSISFNMYNQMGSPVLKIPLQSYSGEKNKITIDTNQFPNGIYLLKWTIAQNHYVQTIIIIKP